jgi:NAD(P)-dependent dehydrogenase (short-subunit alcohol dehydrogenase family)
MAYFVTGGTGFIGRRFILEILAHGEPVYLLLRKGSRARFERLIEAAGSQGRLVTPIEGDLAQPWLGLSDAAREQLRGAVRHFVHLGALYDLAADAAALEQANVAGTRYALELARDVRAGCFHFTSSIAAAGRYPGVFTERMFEEAVELDEPYFRTKHAAEALVRSQTDTPWRIYRPGMVVGHSLTGEMDKIDGPYYLFKLIQQVRDRLPRWFPLVGIEGGHVNLVPVDFVVRALDHLVRAQGLDGECFHLTDPEDRRVGEVVNVFAKAAHAPTLTLRLGPGIIDTLAQASRGDAAGERPVRRILERAMQALDVPMAVLSMLSYPTRFDASRTQALLEPAGIKVPRLEDYAWRLWDYWERHLDPEVLDGRTLRAAVAGKSVLITGGSSGIGRATAIKLARAAARVIIVGRTLEKLLAARESIERQGGEVWHYVCDLADEQACRQLIVQLLEDHGHIDILINNAGRSIRRGIDHTYERWHDYERLMRINYFGAVHLTLGLLPSMVEHGSGQVLSISSIGAITHAARFAAYNASKAALEAFTRCAAAEYRDRNVRFTVINMPLVRTPMVSPTKLYDHARLLEPEQAADLVCAALIRRPLRVATGLGTLAQLVEALAPWVNTAFMSESFRIYPESEAALGVAEAAHATIDPEARADAAALSSLLHGIHC